MRNWLACDPVSDLRTHWDDAYWEGVEQKSWHQSEAGTSLELIAAAGVAHDAGIIDIGGGASVLVDSLLEQRFINVTVLDISPVALDIARRRLGVFTDSVKWIEADVLAWRPTGSYDVWHDRAVLHFLTTDNECERYMQTLRAALDPGGVAIIGTFAEDGPTECSGLPVRRYSATDQAALLGDDFAVIETRRELHETPSAVEQSFNWTLARRK